MHTQIILDHYEKSSDYLGTLHSSDSANALQYFLQASTNLPLDTVSILVTNMNQAQHSQDYVLKIARDELHFLEFFDHSDNHIRYDFQHKQWLLNKRIMGDFFEQALSKRFSDIINDLKSARSFFYIERL